MTILHLYTINPRFNPRLPGGRRPYRPRRPRPRAQFQSTPSGGKATFRGCTYRVYLNVSIHAFRGEGDRRCALPRSTAIRFNPRLPGGRRLRYGHCAVCRSQFQSTPSGGKATEREHPGDRINAVSIHAFRGEGDSGRDRSDTPARRFNPRLPGGRRPVCAIKRS